MDDKITLGLLIAVGFIGTTVAAPALAQAVESFLNIEKAEVAANGELEATLTAEGLIPTDGSEGAFGYGILTEDGDAIVVATTHAGVLDSEEQRFVEDPTWHTHLVRLGDVAECGEDQGVGTDEFEGSNSITSEDLTMRLGEDVSNVVSFRLNPIFDEQAGLQAVCVTDITAADDIDVNSIAQPQQQ
jgi:hypothetical protein